jgi:amidohydrolase
VNLTADAAGLQSDLVALRRAIHRDPEIGLEVPRTQRRVLDALHGLPLTVRTGQALNSVVAVLHGGAPGAERGGSVLLRGDMDALPVPEDTGLPFAATDGVMHACGHDLHVAMLVGAARLLAARAERLPGDVVFMFQPGEEGQDGAGAMLAEGGLLDAGRSPLVGAYTLHVLSAMLPRGVFGTRPGSMMAAASGLFVTVRGKGGHGSQPHTTRDPVPVACEMVTALHTLVTRVSNIFDPVVLSVGSFHAGALRNIIPDTATFQATVRTFSDTARQRIAAETVRLCHALAEAHGLTAEVEFRVEYPETVNDAEHADFFARTARDLFGADRFAPMPFPLPGSEDFSRVLAATPGAYGFLGACVTDDPANAPTNHSPRADFDESVLCDGAAMLAGLAEQRLLAVTKDGT